MKRKNLGMHDLKLHFLFETPSLPALSSIDQTPGSAGFVFWENMRLVLTLGMIPGNSFMNGELWGYCVDRAMRKLNLDDPSIPEVQQRASRLWDRYDQKGFSSARVKHFKEATGNAVQMVSLPGRENSHEALHTLLKAMILYSWSSFEVLAQDLLEEAHSQNPQRFRSHKNSRITGREKIRKAYLHSFSRDRPVIEVIESGPIDAVALLRNVLVHKAGIADEEFVKALPFTPLSQKLSNIRLGERILLDGAVTRFIVDETVKFGFGLIFAVQAAINRQ